jgi:hypothetical protein
VATTNHPRGARSTAQSASECARHVGSTARATSGPWPSRAWSFCDTENPDLIQSIADQDDYSFITFSWNAAGQCDGIGNSTQSFYIPQ